MVIPNYPRVDWSPLAELPDVYEKGRARSTRQEALSDLDTADPKAMEKKGALLIASGNPDNIALGLRLQEGARATRGQAHAISQDLQWQKIAPEIARALRGAPEEEPPPTMAPGAPTPSIWDDPAGAVPGVSQGPAPGGPPGMAGSPGSPSDAIIAQAQAAMAGGGPPPTGPPTAALGPPMGAPSAPPAPPVQLAQAGPPGPSWLPGAQAPAVPAAPQVPGGPIAVPSDRPLPAGGPVEAAKREAQKLEGLIIGLPKNTPSGVVQGLMAKLRTAYEKTRLPPNVVEYEMVQAQRRTQGLPREPIETWEAKKNTRDLSLKETQEIYKEYKKGGKTAEDSLRVIDRMEQIVNHPQFVSGRGAALYGSAVSGLNTLAQVAKSHGIVPPDIEALKAAYDTASDEFGKAKASTKLMEEYTALSNKLVFATLGTLGNQISEGDRKFIEAAFPSLSLTPDGNRALLKFLRQAAMHAKAEADDANEYRRTAKHEQNVPDMEHFLGQRREARRLWTTADGGLTPEGKAVLAAVQQFGGGTQPGAQPGAPAQAPPRTVPADTRFWINGVEHKFDPSGKPVPVR